MVYAGPDAEDWPSEYQFSPSTPGDFESSFFLCLGLSNDSTHLRCSARFLT